MIYVLDVSVTNDYLEQLVTEEKPLLVLQTIKEEIVRYREEEFQNNLLKWENEGLLQVVKDDLSEDCSIEDHLVAFCKNLQEKKGTSVQLLSNDLLVHLKARLVGVDAVSA